MDKQVKIIVILLLSILNHINVSAQHWNFLEKLSGSQVDLRTQVGYSLAISGNYMLVGAPSTSVEKDEVNYSNAGLAYLFKLNNSGHWEEVQQIISPDPKGLGYFGTALDINGDFALIGAYNEYDEVMDTRGKVYAYVLNSGQLVVTDTLTAEQVGNGSNFGISLAMNDNYALIGAPRNHYDINNENYILESGAVFLYMKNTNNTWDKVRKLVSIERNKEDNFGHFLDMDNHGLAISAHKRNDSPILLEAGAVYAYHCTADCEFETIESIDLLKVVPSDANFLERFGSDVAISNNWLSVGRTVAIGPELGDGSWGAVNFFKWENGQWVERQKIYASDGKNNAVFGGALSIDGPICIIGASGESLDENGENQVFLSGGAYIIELQNDETWKEVKKITGTERDYGDFFGATVDLDKTSLGIGAWGADSLLGEFINEGGVLYTYERDEPLVIDPISRVSSISCQKLRYRILDNPSRSGFLLIDISDIGFSRTEVFITTIDGRFLKKSEIIHAGLHSIDLSLLPKGCYLISFRDIRKNFQTILWNRL